MTTKQMTVTALEGPVTPVPTTIATARSFHDDDDDEDDADDSSLWRLPSSLQFLDDDVTQSTSSAVINDINKNIQFTNTSDNDDEEEEYIRQLAASLAPAVEELDALFASPSSIDLSAHLERLRQMQQQQQYQHSKIIHASSRHNGTTNTQKQSENHGNRNTSNDENHHDEDDKHNNYNNDNDNDNSNDDDESFDNELQNLASAEILLRQELEFAQDFGAMMNTPILNTKIIALESPFAFLRDTDDQQQQQQGRQPPPDPIPMASLLDHEEDDDDSLTNDQYSDESFVEQQQNYPIDNIPTSHHDNGIENLPQQQQLHESPEMQALKGGSNQDTSIASPTTSSISHHRHDYTLSDHSHYLQIQTEDRGGWYTMPMLDFDPTVKECIIPLPEKELDRLYVGFHIQDDCDTTVMVNDNDMPMETSSPRRLLPFRTVGIKIRPDVLVGAVMDAIMHALQDDCDVQKRQGGHLILTTTMTKNNVLTVFELDFQLVSYKSTSGSRFCERTLIIRIFYCPKTSPHYSERGKSSPPSLSFTPFDDDYIYSDDEEGDEGNAETSETASMRLREAAALVQKMELSKQGATEKLFGSGFWGSKPVYPNKAAMQEAIALQLLQNYKPCTSVQMGNVTLPALSDTDWPFVQYSHRFIAAIWSELEERGLSYASLCISSFGQFPALTTLDVHYCSQLRRLTRETMVFALLRSASELEQYAREAEYACANLIQVLKSCFENYKLEPPALPQPLPLNEYPLDFTPHQDICPPWGQKVMEAMNEVTAISSDSAGEKSFDRAEKAVQLVLDAFQRQHDEEQSARLGRKNMQVMDRLAKMQSHMQTSIDKLHQAYTKSAAAKKAADEFHRYAVKARSDFPETEQVPLFKCSILVGSSTGSIYITATQVMFVTQFIPIVGENTVVLLDLTGLEFFLCEPSNSLLNPLPAGVSVFRGGAQVILFRPSYSAARLVVFLEIVQTLGGPNPKHYIGSSNNTSLLEG